MRLSRIASLAGLAASALAEDLLFLEGFQYKEYDEAVALGYTTKLVTLAEWAAMTTEDFSKFKAIILPDPDCGSLSQIKFFEDSKDVWSPAVTGNIILIGTDPTLHFGSGGAKTLIDNSIKFAAAGTTPAGEFQTGLYFALSCYYWGTPTATVDALSRFGDFTVRGDLGCYNKIHLVASSPAIDTLDDAALSDWSCSVHEAFATYPSVGANGFQPLAIAQDVLGVGSQEFGDGTIGLPYILSRGATPAKCGDGTWDASLGEECDDGNAVNGDGCSLSCKCESGLPKGDGTCESAPGNSSSSIPPYGTGASSGYPTAYSTHGPYKNSTVSSSYYATGTPTAGHKTTTCSTPTTPYTPPPYVTPSTPTGPKIIGVEYIVDVTYSSAATSYIPCSTSIRPIYDASTSKLPCYICALHSETVTYASTDFVTVSTTTCTDESAPPTAFPVVVKPCESCSTHTLTHTEDIGGSHTEYTPIPYVAPTPHSHGQTPGHSHTGGETPSLGYATSLIKYPTGPTPTGGYYPATTTDVAYYTGAAVAREGKVAGVLGGALVAVAAFM